MELTSKDAAVVRFVGDFYQVTVRHIAAACFPGVRIPTVSYHVERLRRNNYIRRLDRRSSGDRGGAGGWVYELAAEGRELVGLPRQSRPHAVYPHSLKLVDLYCDFLEAERAGRLKLLRFGIEHWVIPTRLRADISLAFAVESTGYRHDLYIEVDMAGKRHDAKDPNRERAKTIKEKLDGYVEAWKGTSTDKVFPAVIFATRFDYRVEEIEGPIQRHPGRELFRACLFDCVVDTCLEL
jgi:hypothetical protein